MPGAGIRREFDVCKLIDTTTCIGCKACEVACVEWNGYEFRETTFDNTESRAILEPLGIDVSPLRDYLERLLDFATRSRWGKLAMSRARAREAFAPA